MATCFPTLQFHAERCDGCGDCMTACAQAKSGTDDRAQSRIRILPAANGGGPELALCRQCADPICVANCPSGALVKNAKTGVIDWADSKCVNCLLCTAGCSYAGIMWQLLLRGTDLSAVKDAFIANPQLTGRQLMSQHWR